MLLKYDRIKYLPYCFILVFLGLVAWLNLESLFLVALFSYFILNRLRFLRKTWLIISLFLVFVVFIFYGFFLFSKKAFYLLPGIVSSSIPILVNMANDYGITLPFGNVEGLRHLIIVGMTGQLSGIATSAVLATKEFIYIIVGFIVAIGIFTHGRLTLKKESGAPNNLYLFISHTILTRFQLFYKSFETVMGAQLIISAINTFFTGVFVFAIGLPHPMMIIILTFLCGLIPIIGNLISNAIIFCIAIAISLKVAVFSLIFLILIHKGEYFLNSRIIGIKINNPMWLTLLALLIGERVLGIYGMILAPIVLNYLKIECLKILVQSQPLIVVEA